MKVAFACDRFGSGGAERVLCNFANRLAEENNEAEIVCLDVLGSFHYGTDARVPIVRLDRNYGKRDTFLKRKLGGLRNFAAFVQALRRYRPDVIFSVYTRRNCYSILAGRLLRIPVVAAERDHFFTCDSGLDDLLRKIFYRHADGFVHQTRWARSFLREHYRIAAEDLVLPNPVWIGEYPARRPAPHSVISVGRLEEQKNFAGLIRAFSKVRERVPDARLTIYGEGVQRAELESLIERLGLGKSVLLFGNTKNILDAYASAEVFVLFSHGEGYPNALLEALAAGVPCIASDCPVGGPAEMIENGKNGILVAPGDEEALEQAILSLFGDGEMRRAFESEAVKIRKTNDFDVIYAQFAGYLYRVIGRYRLRRRP